MEGIAVSDYYVYGRPTFILFDKEKKVVNKNSSFNEIVELIK